VRNLRNVGQLRATAKQKARQLRATAKQNPHVSKMPLHSNPYQTYIKHMIYWGVIGERKGITHKSLYQ